MLVPFHKGCLTALVQPVVEELVGRLQNANGQVSIESCWRAFQAECSLEVLFFGKLMNERNGELATLLGPGHYGNDRSLTTQLEFLALEPVDRYPSSLPRLQNWTSVEIQVCLYVCRSTM